MIRESILRDLTNDELKNLSIRGEVLDLGGGLNTRYNDILKRKEIINLEHINIDKKRSPTYLLDLNKKINLKKKYDTILCIHTIEHIFNFKNLLESHTFLKVKGNLYIIVPFIFRIHSDPYDYSRLTKQYFVDYYSKDKSLKLTVNELGYGVISSAFSLIEPLFSRFGLRIFGATLRTLSIFLDKILCKFSTNYEEFYDKKKFPLGYLVIIHKK